MRTWEGLNAIPEIKDERSRQYFFKIDRFLDQVARAGILAGQPGATGASGSTVSSCCPNEVDEFEVVHDATEGILSFGRASDFADTVDLSDHIITRIEGFELNTFINLNGDALTGNVVIQSTTVHSGTYAATITNNGAAAASFSMAFIIDADGQTSTTVASNAVSWRAWVRFSALPDATRTILTLEGAAGADQSVLSLTSGGILSLDGTLGTTPLLVDTWYELVGKYESAGSGSHTLLLNRGIEISATPAASNAVVNIVFGKAASAGTYTMIVDDIMLEAGASINVIDYPPEGSVYALSLTADGLLASVWGGTHAAPNRYQACTIPHDGDTSYIAVSGTGDRWQSFTQTHPAGLSAPINAVQFCNITRATTAGSYVNRVAILAFNSSGSSDVTYLTTDTNIGGSSSYQLVAWLQQENPFTSAPWTVDELEAILLVAYADPAAGVEVRISTISAQVDVGTPVQSDYARAIRVTAEEGHIIPAYMVDDGEAIGDNKARLVAGYDGTNAQILLTDSSGRLVTTLVPGSGASDLGKAEDSAHASGDVGVMALAVRADTAAATAANGDYVPLLTDSTGRLWSNTELPDAATLADNVANPTTPIVGSYVHGRRQSGTTYDRVSNEVANANTTGATDDRGLHISDIVKYSRTTLTALNITYDDSPTTATSATVDCSRARDFMFLWSVFRANAPTDIQVICEFSNDGGTTWFAYRNDFWGQLLYDDVAVGTTPGISRCYSGTCVGDFIRFRIVCQGTSASATFVVSNATLILKN